MVRTSDAPPPPPRRRRRRAKPAKPGRDDAAVPVTTITVIRPDRFSDPDAASRWLSKLREDRDEVDREVDEALIAANRALHAQRTAALDPDLTAVSAEHALSVRIGHGLGDRLVDGAWDEAIDVPRGGRRRRSEVLRPQERVAEVLAGRDQIAPYESLLLRARGDLDQGRARDAALQLRVGLESLLAELRERTGSRQADDLAQLEGRRRQTGEAANEALRGDLGPDRTAEITETLELCERVLRRRLAQR
ncbi:MAG: hypothetical protein ACRDK9_06685 [Solirubrobacterales bacterium]